MSLLSSISSSKLALINIIKKEHGLSDKKYRRILHRAAGVHSAKDLDGLKFRKLINYFARSELYQISIHEMTLKQKMFIKNLARQLH